MKYLLCLLAALSFSVSASQSNNDTNNQSNDSVVNSTSAMQNVMINNQNDSAIRMGDIECPLPTASITGSGGEQFDTMVSASFHMPIGASACKKAAESAAAQRLHAATVEQKKLDLLFEDKMVRVCLELHRIAQLSESSLLLAECSKVKPLNIQHSHSLPVKNYESHAKVSDH